MRASMVLVSRRPAFLSTILELVSRQDYPDRELILVLHGVRYDRLPVTVRRRALAMAAAVLELPAGWSLGACLNETVAHATGALIAKIDDDDLYARHYLSEAIDSLLARRADIVGKTEVYLYLTRSRTLLLRFPGSSLMEQGFLHGTSLVFRRELGRNPGFRDMRVNSTVRFVDDCRAQGARTFATSRRHLVVRRFATAHHTWRPTDADLHRDALVIRRPVVDDSPAGLLRLVGDA